MKILVIGGTGHAGHYLVPKLLSEGHEVFVAARGKTNVRLPDGFKGAQFLTLNSAEEGDLSFLKEYGFDTVVDFPGTAYRFWEALKGQIGHLVACGSLWMYGAPQRIPTPEMGFSPCPFPGYHERYLRILEMQAESGKDKTVFTAIMPPNFAGPGKIPLDPMGGRSAAVHQAMMNGEEIILPDGPDGLVSPCDASDIAALFDLAINNREKAAGEIFNVGSEYAITMTEFVKLYGRIHGVEIPVRRVCWEEYTTKVNPDVPAWWHFYSHMVPDISKAKRILGYKPRYTPEEAITRGVKWMKETGLLP